MFDEKDPIKSAFRQYMSRELARPQIAREKDAFVSRHFSPRPFAELAAPGFWIPAFALLGILVLFHRLEPPALGPQPAALSDRVASEQVLDSLEPEPLTIHRTVYSLEKPQVEVKRVASSVGPTMVYQKTYREAPVTIVWVFAGGPKP